MKPTVREVAKRAVVSLGTVSKVLNADPSVHFETAQRVTQAIRELDYVPLRRRTRKASRLVGGELRGRQVGLLLLGMDRALVEVPTVAELVQGAQAALTSAGATVVLAEVATPQALPPFLINGELTGLLIKGSLQGDVLAHVPVPLRERLQRLPTVWLLGRPAGSWGDALVPDLTAGAELAVEHLVACGHTNVGSLNPKQQHWGFRVGANAFAHEAHWRGIQVREFVGRDGGDLPQRPVEDAALVQDLVDQALETRPVVTALYCPTNNLARLVYRALAVRGQRVGADISVISAGYEPEANSALHPSLTTVDYGTGEMGERAVELLTWRLAHPHQRSINLSIVPRLVAGESVSRIRH